VRAPGVIHSVHVARNRYAMGGAKGGLACYEGGPYERAPASIADGRGCWTWTPLEPDHI
jgi:hypothetical protein